MQKVYCSKRNDLLEIWLRLDTGELFVWYCPEYGWSRQASDYVATLNPILCLIPQSSYSGVSQYFQD